MLKAFRKLALFLIRKGDSTCSNKTVCGSNVLNHEVEDQADLQVSRQSRSTSGRNSCSRKTKSEQNQGGREQSRAHPRQQNGHHKAVYSSRSRHPHVVTMKASLAFQSLISNRVELKSMVYLTWALVGHATEVPMLEQDLLPLVGVAWISQNCFLVRKCQRGD